MAPLFHFGVDECGLLTKLQLAGTGKESFFFVFFSTDVGLKTVFFGWFGGLEVMTHSTNRLAKVMNELIA